MDISVVTTVDEHYPSRLSDRMGRDAPPALFCYGNLDLLHRPGVTFSGARDADDSHCSATVDLVTRLSEREYNIISGFAPGIDMTAHFTALVARGATTLSLATGLLHFPMDNELTPLFNDTNHLVLSEFLPRARWAAFQAMMRNRTMAALADAVVIVQPGLTGGTYNMGRHVLKHHLPLYLLIDDLSVPLSAGERHFADIGTRVLTSECFDRFIDNLTAQRALSP
jgi:DNA processing protein